MQLLDKIHTVFTAALKANCTATTNYRIVMEENEASRAQQQTGLYRLPGVTGNTPMPTAVHSNGVLLESVSVNVMGGQGTLPSSRQAATSGNFVYEGEFCSEDL